MLIHIHHALQLGEPIVVATVISSRGSTPRAAGSKMIVYAGGAISGTIGGGAVEGDVIKRALTALDTKRGSIACYDLREDSKSGDLDLICGGRMKVLLEYVDAQPGNESLYEAASKKIASERPFLWKGVITEADGGVTLERSIEEITDLSGGGLRGPSLHASADGLVLVEPVMPAQTVYIIGAGHVSKELATLTNLIGMKTLVFDDRSAFACQSRFPAADEIHLCPGYVNIFEPFKITPNSYIIIVTRGHSYDKEVLGQALKTRAGYIGMMGSRTKRQSIYNALIAEGCHAEELDRVHCPIGLQIKAETPAELAISIVAELIDHRASATADG